MAWELFAHDADIGVRGTGNTKAEAFEEGAVALTAVVTNPEIVRPLEAVLLNCEAPDDELLFAEWLNALIYEMSTRKMLFRRFEIVLSPGRLEARAWGEPVNIERHQPAVEIKGATYTALDVHQTADGIWTAQCVVDV